MKSILVTLLFLASTLPLAAPRPSAQSRPMLHQKKITTFLWFNGNAEEAIRHYSSIFADSKILGESRYGEGAPFPKGSLMFASFTLCGREFMALNGGPMYRFNEAISLFVNCETQAEIDDLWDRLTAGGGEPGQCGWLKDKFGLSWQIIPNALGTLLSDPDPARAGRVVAAMLPMKKLDIKALQKAADGK
jgi:predicted 3-demethylubiquinone-9 3-methyltransferase (glyoxalase superfamily)